MGVAVFSFSSRVQLQGCGQLLKLGVEGIYRWEEAGGQLGLVLRVVNSM